MKIYLFLVLLLMLPFASAYSESYYGYYGQNQYYYVVFDGEGEAAVIARLEIQNTENISDLQFSIPGQDVEIINIVQEYYELQKQCVEWGSLVCEGESCSQECDSYQWLPTYSPKYAEVEYTTEDSKEGFFVNIDEIPQQDQLNLYIIVYYKTSYYVTQNGGVFEYDFQTIKDEYDTTSVRVSLDVAEDMYLEGVSSDIQYRTEMAKGAFADVASFASSIAYVDTGYTESASSLDPYESFSVDGKYASSWWYIHGWKVLVGALVGLGLIVLGILGLRKINKKHKDVAMSLLLGLCSGILLWAVWVGSLFLLNNGYWGYYWSMMQGLVMMLAVLMSIVLLILPSVGIGIKKGFNNGLWCFIATVATIFVLGVITIGVVLIFFNGSSYPILY